MWVETLGMFFCEYGKVHILQNCFSIETRQLNSEILGDVIANEAHEIIEGVSEWII